MVVGRKIMDANTTMPLLTNCKNVPGAVDVHDHGALVAAVTRMAQAPYHVGLVTRVPVHGTRLPEGVRRQYDEAYFGVMRTDGPERAPQDEVPAEPQDAPQISDDESDAVLSDAYNSDSALEDVSSDED